MTQVVDDFPGLNGRRITVLCDFDGTISRLDVGVALLEQFAIRDWTRYEDDYRTQRIGSRDCLRGQLACLPPDRELLQAFAVESVPIDPGFVPFVEECRTRGVDVAVVSDGFSFYIRPFLEKHGVGDLAVWANETAFHSDGAVISFPHSNPECGLCGNCKKSHLERYRADGSFVVFVGDGHSDRYVAQYADRVFARDALVGICREASIPFQPFDSFFDVLQGVRELWPLTTEDKEVLAHESHETNAKGAKSGFS